MYRLYSRGFVMPGKDRLEVMSDLASFLDSDAIKVKRLLLSGEVYPICSGNSHAALRVYERKMLELGLNVYIEQH